MTYNILGLTEYRITSVPEEAEHDLHIRAVVALPKPTHCPYCNGIDLVGHGDIEVLIKDLPMRGKHVGIFVTARRLRCRDETCRKSFTEPLPAVHDSRRMTTRLLTWIGKESLRRTFTSIADDVGVTEGTIRHIFSDYVAELEKKFQFEAPKWMGIDEIHIIKRPRAVISNIHASTIVDMLADRSKKTVATYLSKLDGHEGVQYVAIDMWNPYKDAVNAVMPQARVVVDKFHVLRMGNLALEAARKAMRKELTPKQRRGLMHDRYVLSRRRNDLTDEQFLLLDGWAKNYPLLGAAYDLKERYFNIYEAETKDEALSRFESWQKSIPAELYEHFKLIVTAWSNWKPEILNYFEHQITNSVTESLNNLIRGLDRAGRGYSFEALRAKVLFSERAHKHTRPRFTRQRTDKMPANTDVFSMLEASEPSAGYDVPGVMERMTEFGKSHTKLKEPKPTKIPNYGVDISTLLKLLEQGEI